ncbi:putative glycosyl transferase [Candidatus Termititenax aidoneus]|uniref:Glycosyl transferase n=1 Tax=Termititenax aidoneus TaxID=2218524 RepID=A0A388TBR5_TERA1|nr:putative glycosyl transferase [Candidatus Termititenax aidoneus]
MSAGQKKILFIFWCLGLVCFFRWETFITPFGNDEGIYAYLAQQVGQGAVLYHDVTELKFPLLMWLAAPITRLPGLTQINLLIFDLLVALLTVGLFCRIIRKYTDAFFWPTTAFIIFTNAHRISQGGFMTEHYIVLFVLLAWSFWLREHPSIWSDLLAGCCFALAAFTKQVGVVTVVALGLYALWRCRKEPEIFHRCLYVAGGFFCIAAAVLFYLQATGVLLGFWQDCIVDIFLYREAQGRSPLLDFLWAALDNIISVALLWFMVFAALFKKTTQPLRTLFLLCAILEFLAFAIGKTFFTHQILPLAPTLGFIVALSLPEKFYFQYRKALLVLLAIALLAQSFFTVKACRRFPDLLDDYRLARYIEQNSTPQDVLDSGSEATRIAFLAKRKHFYKRPYMAYPFSPEEIAYIREEFNRLKPLYAVDGLSVFANPADYRFDKAFGRHKLWRRI